MTQIQVPGDHFSAVSRIQRFMIQPVSAGFSFSSGSQVNNSRGAALDVYDFPKSGPTPTSTHCNRKKLYIPRIATVIREGNRAIAAGKGQPGAKRSYLEPLMIYNPFTLPTTSESQDRYFSTAAFITTYTCRPHDVDSCYPEFEWVRELFNERRTKTMQNVLSFKLIHSPYQQSFINSQETSWPVTSQFERGYVRQVGDGAGNMTFVLVEGVPDFSTE
ncbi:hypothetical protein F5876DRAFT_63595 [Lentinula aff. lateritia]|uniref:Uncharacterized protein n=1 Tax=Lentinula aff. lateritia TaxID=2804960 RepID=A0ACC1U8E6_9AGAR|nr:hypothetical protein F5876DRAFT_63595 [Lentinula aff. lateritia]